MIGNIDAFPHVNISRRVWPHCKKRLALFPSPAPNSPWQEIITLFPARKSLVSDIPDGDGKIVNLFLTVHNLSRFHFFIITKNASGNCQQKVITIKPFSINNLTTSTDHTCPRSLSWAGRRVGPALYGLLPLCRVLYLTLLLTGRIFPCFLF